jgi:hypothetical protein
VNRFARLVHILVVAAAAGTPITGVASAAAACVQCPAAEHVAAAAGRPEAPPAELRASAGQVHEPGVRPRHRQPYAAVAHARSALTPAAGTTAAEPPRVLPARSWDAPPGVIRGPPPHALLIA